MATAKRRASVLDLRERRRHPGASRQDKPPPNFNGCYACSCGRPVLARSCFRRQMQLVPEADPRSSRGSAALTTG